MKLNTEGMTWDLNLDSRMTQKEKEKKALTRDKTAQKKTAF